MARITHVKRAQQRYETVPVIDPETGEPKRTPVMKKVKDWETGEVTERQKTTKSGKPVFRAVVVEDRSKPLPPYTCGACHKPIEVGTPYKWVQPKNRGKMTRHEDCPTWKTSELSSSKMVTVYAAQESFEDGKPYETSDDFASALEEVAEAVREVGGEYGESADNIEQYFQGSEKGEELREWADSLESWADEIEQAASTIRDLEDNCAECHESEEDGPHHDFEAPEAEEGDEEPADECALVDCGASEDDHHEFDASGWEDEADSEADVINNSPL